MKQDNLERDLKDSGASAQEIVEFTELAKHLDDFKAIKLSDNARKSIGRIPEFGPKPQRKFINFALPGFAMATAIFALIFTVNIFFIDQSSPNVPVTEQVREEELKEIETILQQSETELQELKQAEQIQPEAVEQAEDKYEDALMRWQMWEEKYKNDQTSRFDRWRSWQQNDEDVRGTWDGHDDTDKNYENKDNFRRTWTR